MSESKSKSKTKSETKVQVKTVKPEELEKELELLRNLQRIVVVRYSIYFGRKHLMGLKMRDLQPELKKMREIKKKMTELYEEAESSGRLNVTEIKKLKKAYGEIKKEYNKKAEPYDKKIRPLTKHLKHIDEDIIRNHPAVKPYLKNIYDVNDIPEEFRIPEQKK